MKTRIILAAIEIIQNRGMRFTIDEIARTLCISKRTIYNNFETKDQIIEAVIDYAFDELEKEEKEILHDERQSVFEKLESILCAWPASFRLNKINTLTEIKYQYPLLWAKAEKSLGREWRVICEIIEKGILDGEIRPVDHEILQKMIIGSLKEILDPGFLVKSNFSLDAALKTMAHILIGGLKT